MLLQGLLDPRVSARESRPEASPDRLFPEELAAIENAVEKRRQEFAAGRLLAREALIALGRAPCPIPAAADRSPVWPTGFTGSISHSSTWCVAAVGRHSDGIRSIGVDIEEASPLDEAFAEDICARRERDWLAHQPTQTRGLFLKAIFSAKESAYKCQYPLTGILLNYDAMSIGLDVDAGSFTATFETDAAPFAAGHRLAGKFRIASGHIATTMVLSSARRHHAATGGL